VSRLAGAAAAAWLLAVAAPMASAQPSALPPAQEIVETLKPAAARGAAGASASLSLVIEFEPNSARVRPASGPTLGNLVAALLAPELQNSRFVIEGQGEPGTSAQARQQLAQRRADEVRLYLVALGVPASRLRAVGTAEAAAGSQTPPAAGGRVRVVALE
jgi:outer membrane protein OmpA-like peptidoglycan-associated protein